MITSLLENLFSQGTIERLGWMLVHFLWQAAAVALLLAILLRQPGREFDLTLDEVFKRYIVPQSLSGQATEALIGLLQSQSGAAMLSMPRLLAHDGIQAEIHIAGELPLVRSVPSAGVETVEYGTVIKATAHVLDRSRVALKLMAEMSDPVPGFDANEPVIARLSAETNVITWNDRYLLWAAIEPAATDPEASRESVYVMVKPSLVEPVQGREDAVADEPSAAANLRQVRLEVRTVRMERDALLNLEIEWGRPITRASVLSGPSAAGVRDAEAADGWPRNIQIGYAPDRQLTESLLAALDLLQKNHQADVSSQQILVQEGRQCQIKNVNEHWFAFTGQKTDTGTILSVAPRVGDNNDITLEMAFEVSNMVPRGQGGVDLPVVTRRTAKNSVTIRDGGTVALAGMVENHPQPNGEPAREIAVFVTAHLVRDLEETVPETPSSAVTPIPTPATDAVSADHGRTAGL